MKGNSVDFNNEAPSFRDSFGWDRVAEPRWCVWLGFRRVSAAHGRTFFEWEDSGLPVVTSAIWICHCGRCHHNGKHQNKSKKSQVDTQGPCESHVLKTLIESKVCARLRLPCFQSLTSCFSRKGFCCHCIHLLCWWARAVIISMRPYRCLFSSALWIPKQSDICVQTSVVALEWWNFDCPYTLGAKASRT